MRQQRQPCCCLMACRPPRSGRVGPRKQRPQARARTQGKRQGESTKQKGTTKGPPSNQQVREEGGRGKSEADGEGTKGVKGKTREGSSRCPLPPHPSIPTWGKEREDLRHRGGTTRARPVSSSPPCSSRIKKLRFLGLTRHKKRRFLMSQKKPRGGEPSPRRVRRAGRQRTKRGSSDAAAETMTGAPQAGSRQAKATSKAGRPADDHSRVPETGGNPNQRGARP
jgi:hypothetical protein